MKHSHNTTQRDYLRLQAENQLLEDRIRELETKLKTVSLQDSSNTDQVRRGVLM